MYDLALKEANAKSFELDGEKLKELQTVDEAWKDKEAYFKDVIKKGLEDGKIVVLVYICVYHLMICLRF